MMVAAFGEKSRLPGIEPDVGQFSLLAGAYAGRAERHETVRILDRIEGALRDEDVNRSSRHSENCDPPSACSQRVYCKE